MALHRKYSIIHIILCAIIFIIGLLGVNKYIWFNEGFSNLPPGINYNNLNSQKYSHTVNLPINDPISCTNFCGPKATCAKTGEQCTSDIDCPGCNPGQPDLTSCETKDVPGYTDTSKWGQNHGLAQNSLLEPNNNIDFDEIYPGSRHAELTQNYQGMNTWTSAFNQGLGLYNKSREFNNGPTNAEKKFVPTYPTTVSTTGLFYNTGPPAANT